jgi:UDP-N-acetylglucosamine--N-acetylmuramyl-(pentapeptide) pyrophosphoryl-undecaprenol N-acetylglucosamine transferase
VIAPLHRKRVVFAGGGTGGHLFPALALARALPSVEPVFLVPPDRGDEKLLRGEFRSVAFGSPRVDRAPWLYPARLAWAVRRARAILRDERASAVVGLGGYASVPASIAARTLGLPLYLVECNAVPGKATRALARWADGIGLASAQARDGLAGGRADCKITGTPLRRELFDEYGGAADFGLEPGVKTLLVIGGSQGATRLNERVVDGLATCRDLRFQVLHCTGDTDAARIRADYDELGIRAHVVGFLSDIGRAYAAADLVLARAGASTVAECLALGRPAVFVPFPWHKDRQQHLNAREAAACGAARVVEQQSLSPMAVRLLVKELLLRDEERDAMAEYARAVGRPSAARDMAAHVLESFGDALAVPGGGSAIVEIGG